MIVFPDPGQMVAELHTRPVKFAPRLLPWEASPRGVVHSGGMRGDLLNQVGRALDEIRLALMEIAGDLLGFQFLGPIGSPRKRERASLAARKSLCQRLYGFVGDGRGVDLQGLMADGVGDLSQRGCFGW